MEFLQQYQGLTTLVVTILIGLGGLVFRSQVMALVADKASTSSLNDLSARLQSHDQRLVTMEAAIKHLPTGEQMTALTLTVAELRGDIREVREQVRGVKEAVGGLTRRFDLVDEHLKARD